MIPTVHVTGYEGLGDIVLYMPYLLSSIDSPTHIHFHVSDITRSGVVTETVLHQMMHACNHEITYTITDEWNTSIIDQAKLHIDTHYPTDRLFFSTHLNLPWECQQQAEHTANKILFKQQWEPNDNGPICLALNHNEHISAFPPNHPYRNKFFNKSINDELLSFADDKNYVVLGLPKSLDECINALSKCKRLIGIEGGWAHVAQKMNVPLVLCLNKAKRRHVKKMANYEKATIIKTEDIHKYL